MELIPMEKNGVLCALVTGEGKIEDAQSALDLLMTARHTLGTKNIVIGKELLGEDFFRLGTGLAGEMLQKYINYGGRIAIYGDVSRYTSKPLHDFIYESNHGRDVFFTATQEEAVDRLTR